MQYIGCPDNYVPPSSPNTPNKRNVWICWSECSFCHQYSPVNSNRICDSWLKKLHVLNFLVLLPCSVALAWVKDMDRHPEDKENSPAMVQIVLLPGSVALRWVKAMGCCPEEKDDTLAVMEIAKLSVIISKT